MSIADGQPVNSQASNAAFVSRSSTQTIGGAKTFTDTTESTDKDSGAVVLEGGLGVEKNINAGGDISAVGNVNAANMTGSNTGDVSLDPIGAAPNPQGASLAGQVLTLQPADGSNGGVLTASAQTIGGDKTFVDNVVVQGNFQVDGTLTSVNSTNLEVEDQNILVNKNGNDASAEAAGVDVERTTGNAGIRFDSTLASKWKLGLLSALYEVIVAGVAQTITGIKTFTNEVVLSSWLQFNGATSGNIKLKVPAVVTTHDLIFPAAQGAANTFIKNDGAGNLSWDAGGGGSSLTVQDEGSTLSTAVTKINFAGAGVVATQPVANEILVTVAGGGGGGGVSFANHYNATVTGVSTSVLDTWTTVATLTMLGGFFAGQEYNVIYDGTVLMFSNVSASYTGGVRIIDYNSNVVDNTLVAIGFTATGAGSISYKPTHIRGRYTFYELVGSPFFRLQIRTNSTDCTVSAGYKEITGALSGDDSGEKFYSYENVF